MLTFAEQISTGLREGVSAQAEAVAYDSALRARASLLLTSLAQQAYVLAPYWWKHGDGTVNVSANATKGTCPVDFNNFGTEGSVWLQGANRPLDWLEPAMLEALRQSNPNQRQDPTHYTLKSQTVLGVRELDVWPTPGRNVVLLLQNYARRLTEFIDAPVAPGVALNAAAGNVNGVVSYRVVFVHATGKTEGGAVSADLTAVNQKVDVNPIATSPARTVTARELYRTAGGGVQHKLVATINDNLTTKVLLENVSDGSLGANVPTPAEAVSGMEQFPSDFHQSVFVQGLIEMLRAQKKGVPFDLFSEEWKAGIRRMWADQRQDRHVARAMPPYGGLGGGRRRSWRYLSS